MGIGKAAFTLFNSVNFFSEKPPPNSGFLKSRGVEFDFEFEKKEEEGSSSLKPLIFKMPPSFRRRTKDLKTGMIRPPPNLSVDSDDIYRLIDEPFTALSDSANLQKVSCSILLPYRKDPEEEQILYSYKFDNFSSLQNWFQNSLASLRVRPFEEERKEAISLRIQKLLELINPEREVLDWTSKKIKLQNLAKDHLHKIMGFRPPPWADYLINGCYMLQLKKKRVEFEKRNSQKLDLQNEWRKVDAGRRRKAAAADSASSSVGAKGGGSSKSGASLSPKMKISEVAKEEDLVLLSPSSDFELKLQQCIASKIFGLPIGEGEQGWLPPGWEEISVNEAAVLFLPLMKIDFEEEREEEAYSFEILRAFLKSSIEDSSRIVNYDENFWQTISQLCVSYKHLRKVAEVLAIVFYNNALTDYALSKKIDLEEPLKTPSIPFLFAQLKAEIEAAPFRILGEPFEHKVKWRCGKLPDFEGVQTVTNWNLLEDILNKNFPT